MSLPQQFIKLLGHRVTDRVTGFDGVVTSISFDLYGCIQAVVSPGAKDGQVPEGRWFDVARLEVTSAEPVMQQPNFESGPQAEGLQGAADKPQQRSI